MQRYGVIVADHGSDMFISGAFEPRRNNEILNPAFRSLTASDFDVIELGWREGAAAVPGCNPPSSPAPFTYSRSGAFVRLAWASSAGARD